MNNQEISKWLLSLYFWILTIVCMGLIYWPIWNKGIDFEFLLYNIFFILSFLTFTRWIFLLKYSMISGTIIPKMLLMILAVISVVFAYRGLNLYNIHVNTHGYYTFVEHLPIDEQYFWGGYLRNQYLFFGIGSLISGIILPFRMLISIFNINKYGAE